MLCSVSLCAMMGGLCAVLKAGCVQCVDCVLCGVSLCALVVIFIFVKLGLFLGITFVHIFIYSCALLLCLGKWFWFGLVRSEILGEYRVDIYSFSLLLYYFLFFHVL